MPTEGKVLYLKKSKRFTLEEARKNLPMVRSITEVYIEETMPLIDELQSATLTEPERERISRLVQKELEGWTSEITQLGAVTKGLWLVDFDTGGGYYCWRYNEEDVNYFHGYNEGFDSRVPIQ